MDVTARSLLCHSNSTKIMSLTLSCESMAQPLADKIFLTSQRSLFSHSARQDVFLSLTFTNLKQNYSVIAHGYKDKARSRRREGEKESIAEKHTQSESEILFIFLF